MKKVNVSAKSKEALFSPIVDLRLQHICLYCGRLINSRTMECIWIIAFLFFLQGKISAQSNTTKGTEFWVSFMENLDLNGNGQPKFSFFISCDISTNGIISIPATGYTQAFTATVGQITEVFLPNGIFYPIGSEHIEQCGIKVTSTNPITLGAQHHRLYFSDASIVLPVTQLADNYIVLAHKDDGNYGGFSEFIVEATENNTIIDIVPSCITRMLKPPGIPITVTLQQGEVYQVQSGEDLTGTSITAREGKKIAVFSGANSGTIECGATNHLYDQNYPISLWGNEYLLVPFVPGYTDMLRILAKDDSTLVYSNCQPPILLNKGQYYDLQLNSPLRITSSHPITIGQFKKGQICSSLGDCTFIINTPVSFNAKKIIFSSLQTAIVGADPFTVHYVNIVAKSANTISVKLDNAQVAFTPIPSNPIYSCAQVSVTVGPHTLVSDSGFYAFAAGFGFYDGYSYFLGYDNKYILSQNNLKIMSPDSLCSLSSGNFYGNASSSLSSWNWDFGDGGTSNQQNSAHSFVTKGTYSITLLATDSVGCPYLAEQTVYVSCIDKSIDCEIFVPTAFSPNNNGIDDYECVYGACIKEMEFIVYSQWGEIVFKTTDQSKCWDGTLKDGKLNNAVFAWTLGATLYSGKQITKKGNLTIVK